jgi:hypothetical protein
MKSFGANQSVIVSFYLFCLWACSGALAPEDLGLTSILFVVGSVVLVASVTALYFTVK